jgi:NTE family protein
MPLEPLPDASTCAVILAGAGSKGAFEAGALSVVLAAGHRFGTVVGSSAGALNGALLAAAGRAGAELAAAAVLPDVWVEHADFLDVFSPSIEGLLGRRGFSSEEKLSSALERHAIPWLPGASRPVRLVMVTTSLRGRPTQLGGVPATTYEHPVSFANADFDEPARRRDIWRVAGASAAIPVLFVPVDLPGAGPCADGGLVNNTPIKYALADPAVARVFVVVPYPSPVDPEPTLRGLDLVVHCIDILIQERLQRDLHEAFDVNQQVRAQKAPPGKRVVEIVQIRPQRSLGGTDLSGFGNKALRKAQLQLGIEAARAALERGAAT